MVYRKYADRQLQRMTRERRDEGKEGRMVRRERGEQVVEYERV
jgi:hypothetical protein